MTIYCTNGCGIVLPSEVLYLGNLPYCPMCGLSGGKKYEHLIARDNIIRDRKAFHKTLEEN